MEKQHAVYFSAKMDELMEKFNALSEAEGACAGTPVGRAMNADLVTMRKDAREFAAGVHAEFEKAGYGESDWVYLQRHCGAAKTAGM